MKHLICLLWTAVLLWGSGVAYAITYDLAADWSDTVNPNGTWSYLVNGSVASGSTRTGDAFSAPLPIWGSGYTGWSKSQGTELFPHDWQNGDVFGHTPNSGAPMQIRWTSPTDGIVDVVGSVWPTRDIGRFNVWLVRLDGSVLWTGSVGSGDPYSRANPFAFSSSGLAVKAGDVIEFSVSKESGWYGDYLGVDLAMSFVPTNVPETGYTLLLLFGAFAPLTALNLARHRHI